MSSSTLSYPLTCNEHLWHYVTPCSFYLIPPSVLPLPSVLLSPPVLSPPSLLFSLFFLLLLTLSPPLLLPLIVFLPLPNTAFYLALGGDNRCPLWSLLFLLVYPHSSFKQLISLKHIIKFYHSLPNLHPVYCLPPDQDHLFTLL